MATADYILDNATGANFRSDLNNTLAAIVSNNSSSSEPSTKYAYQWWADTNEGVLKIRNSANDGWVTLLQLDGTLTLEDGSNSAPALGFRDDLNTGIFSSAADTLDITCGGTTRGSFSSSGLAVTGNVSATTFVGDIDANNGDFDGTLEADAITVAGTALNTVIAGVASTNVTVADESSDPTCFPLFVTAATGDLPPKSGSNLAFNSSNGTLTATAFAGDGSALTGVGGTTINNNADNRVITGSGSANTLNGESTLTFDASLLNISSTTQGLGLRLTNTGNEYTEARFDAARTGAGNALGIIQGRWNNANNVCSIYLQTGDDTSNKDDGKISFLTAASGGSEAVRMVIKNDGDVSINDGNMIFASGHGIDFSATSDASSSESTTSMSNELFDDYEVGSWQPTWSAVHGTITPLSRHGDYVKIGRTVHCMFAISANGSSLSNASELKITGLPFSAEIPNANGPRGGGGVVFAGAGMNTDISQVIASGTTLRIKLTDSSFLQTNSSGVSFSYNASQISGMFSFLTAS